MELFFPYSVEAGTLQFLFWDSISGAKRGAVPIPHPVDTGCILIPLLE